MNGSTNDGCNSGSKASVVEALKSFPSSQCLTNQLRRLDLSCVELLYDDSSEEPTVINNQRCSMSNQLNVTQNCGNPAGARLQAMRRI